MKRWIPLTILSLSAVIGLSACQSAAPQPAADPHAGHAGHDHTAAASASKPASAVAASEKPKPAVAESTALKVKPYPLDTCIVSGDKLGDMGKPVVFTYGNQEVKLCCKACRKEFDADPAKFMKELAAKS